MFRVVECKPHLPILEEIMKMIQSFAEFNWLETVFRDVSLRHKLAVLSFTFLFGTWAGSCKKNSVICISII